MPEVIFRPGSKSPSARIEARLGNLSQGDVKVETNRTRTITCLYGNCGSQQSSGDATQTEDYDNG